jgi:hypothetical protein
MQILRRIGLSPPGAAQADDWLGQTERKSWELIDGLGADNKPEQHLFKQFNEWFSHSELNG